MGIRMGVVHPVGCSSLDISFSKEKVVHRSSTTVVHNLKNARWGINNEGSIFWQPIGLEPTLVIETTRNTPLILPIDRKLVHRVGTSYIKSQWVSLAT